MDPLGWVELGTGPPLFAIHGALTSSRLTFEGVASRWADDHRVVLVDRPGFERTPGPAVSVGEQAHRLLATIDAAADDGPVDALACSFGGLVLLAAAQARPAAFSTITLVEVPTIDLCPPDMVAPTRLLQVARAGWERAEQDVLAGFRQVLEVVEPALLAALEPMIRAGNPGVTLLREDLAIWSAMLDRYGLAEAVSGKDPIRVLAVSGTASDPAYRTFGACTAAALHGRHHVVTGAGHAAHLHPGFTEVLLEFLDER